MSKNKTLSKKELAILLGVNKRTLNRWLKPHRNELEKLGVKPCGQIFGSSDISSDAAVVQCI